MTRKLIFILLLCSSCGSTWVVQGVTVHSPTRVLNDRDAYIMGAAALGAFVVADHMVDPDKKNKIHKVLTAN